MIFYDKEIGKVRQQVNFNDKGGGLASQKSDFFMTRGGRGIQNHSKKDDIIYEKPLSV